ncbi:MAG: hypothetical protein ABI678_14610 [Kofleriaceae bacterium]
MSASALRLLAVVVALTSTAAAEPAKSVGNFELSRQGIGLDLDVAGGARLHAGDGDVSRSWFARARAGVLLFSEPTFLSLGAAGQLGPLDSSSLGVELNYSEVFRGFSAQVGIFPLDTTGGTIVEAQLGGAVVGAEYQRRISGPRGGDQVFVLTVQVPLGLIYQMLKTPPGVVRHQASARCVSGSGS